MERREREREEGEGKVGFKRKGGVGQSVIRRTMTNGLSQLLRSDLLLS